MRGVDVFQSIPGLIFALAIAGTLGPSFRNIILALVVTNWAPFARLIRGEILLVKQFEYVDAARILGDKRWRIYLKDILPNAFTPIIVLSTMTLGKVVLTGATLSFLGLAEVGLAEWGNLVSSGQTGLAGRLLVDRHLRRRHGLHLGAVLQPAGRRPARRLRPPERDPVTLPARSRSRHLSIRFRTKRGLVTRWSSSISTIGLGETVGLVGESGSGKTVTGRSLIRLLASPPAVYAGGQAPVPAPPALRRLQGGRLRRLRRHGQGGRPLPVLRRRGLRRLPADRPADRRPAGHVRPPDAAGAGQQHRHGVPGPGQVAQPEPDDPPAGLRGRSPSTARRSCCGRSASRRRPPGSAAARRPRPRQLPRPPGPAGPPVALAAPAAAGAARRPDRRGAGRHAHPRTRARSCRAIPTSCPGA